MCVGHAACVEDEVAAVEGLPIAALGGGLPGRAGRPPGMVAIAKRGHRGRLGYFTRNCHDLDCPPVTGDSRADCRI